MPSSHFPGWQLRVTPLYLLRSDPATVFDYLWSAWETIGETGHACRISDLPRLWLGEFFVF